MYKYLAIPIVFMLLVYCAYAAQEQCDPKPDYDTCYITRIVDGDTVVGICNYRGEIKMRLSGIDSFESKKNRRAKKQAIKYNMSINVVVEKGKQAKEIISNLILNKSVLVTLDERRYGMYGRLLANIKIIKNNSWFNVNKCLLEKHNDVYMEYE